MITRSMYLSGEATHEQYYTEIAEEAGVHFNSSFPATLEKIADALANGDEHLNSIPLAHWDAMAQDRQRNGRINAAMKLRGDYLTRAGVVCTMKTVAKNAANGSKLP